MEKDLEQRESDLIKIVLVGPESTGKTTLTKQLAEYFKTTYVKEYLREFAHNKLTLENKCVEKSDNDQIISNQLELEKLAENKANVFLFCDTNFVQTKIYSELYFKEEEDFFTNDVKKSKYDLYLLTGIDIPWEEDALRDAPFERENHYNYFKKRLMDNNLPFVEISGSQEDRLNKSVQISKDLELSLKKGFTAADLIEFEKRGLSIQEVVNQIEIFEKGIPYVHLEQAAIISNGIVKLSEEELQQKITFFDTHKSKYDIQKLVPASGAASRMFQFLSKFLLEFDPEKDTVNSYINHNKAQELVSFFVGMEKLPFYKNVKSVLKKDFPDYKSWSKDKYYFMFIKILLSKEYLNYCNLPKGVLPFHKQVTPLEEHLKEALYYAQSSGKTQLHFTISEDHLGIFTEVKNKALEEINSEGFEIDFSYQKKSTDTIAVHFDKTPFRTKNGSILFRQAGHGALLENLNDLNSDIIFIKNIDNVSHVYFDDIIKYKKALGGLLMELQDQVFMYLRELDSELSNQKISEIANFCQNNLSIVIPNNFEKLHHSNKIEFLRNKLNRPIRVCGMVKNEGEPGGGPFWVRNNRGEVSLQIVETSQIDKTNAQQKQILDSSTHFNPVDLVCGIKNYKGEKFNLLDYRDNNTGFLTEKTKDGFPILGYELPGLWNGAMADWISVFVEVSLTTFNPVKTVIDLLKPAHQ